MSERLIPPKRGSYAVIEGYKLHCYSAYSGFLSRSAWEWLGEPPAVAIEVDDRGYSIVAATSEDRTGVRVHPNRKISLGVITAALKDAAFPLHISLLEDGTRLRFGTVEGKA